MRVQVGTDSLKKPHYIVTLSFSEGFCQVEGQANFQVKEKLLPVNRVNWFYFLNAC